MAMKWWWAYAPYLDEPEKQAESALKAGYVKVCCKDDVDEEVARLKEEVAAMRKCRDMADDAYFRLKRSMENPSGWRSWDKDPPKFPDSEGFIFCGHEKYDWEEEMRYFVDVGHLDTDGKLCMYNDWCEGEETFVIDAWMPLPNHPHENKGP